MFDYFDMEDEFNDVSTVNGWVMLELDKIPEPGDRFRYKNMEVTVTKADERKALEIHITFENEKEEEEE